MAQIFLFLMNAFSPDRCLGESFPNPMREGEGETRDNRSGADKKFVKRMRKRRPPVVNTHTLSHT